MQATSTQPPTVVRKIKAQLEYTTHNAYMFFFLHVWRRFVRAQSVLVSKISVSELSRKSVVGWVILMEVKIFQICHLWDSKHELRASTLELDDSDSKVLCSRYVQSILVSCSKVGLQQKKKITWTSFTTAKLKIVHYIIVRVRCLQTSFWKKSESWLYQKKKWFLRSFPVKERWEEGGAEEKKEKFRRKNRFNFVSN